MGNMNQAPKLVHSGEKELIIDGKREGFIGIPNSLFSFICNELGDSSSRLRLMFLLIGTGPNWGVSNKWVEDTIGVSKSSYNGARKYLIEQKKWLRLDGGQLIVDFDKIHEDMENKELGTNDCTPKSKGTTTGTQNRGTMVIPQKQGYNGNTPKLGTNGATSILLNEDFDQDWGTMVIPQKFTIDDF